MTRTRWIVFAILCAFVLGGLAFMSKKDAVDVSSVDAATIIAATDTAIGDHVYGDKNAKVILFEYGDFQCPGCGGAFPQLKSIKEIYKEEIAFVYRNFPLTAAHPNALAAAAAAEAAGLQGKFWEMHDKLFENQESWGSAAPEERSSIFESYAKELGLNLEQFRNDAASKKVSEKISRDQALGRKVKVDSTPGVFLGSEELSDDEITDLVQQSGTKLMDKLDAAIKKAGGTVPKRAE